MSLCTIACMVATVALMLLLGTSNAIAPPAVSLTVGESRAVTTYANLKRISISAKSADAAICSAEATASGAIRLVAGRVGQTRVEVRGTYRPESSKANIKIDDAISVVVNPRSLPEYYYDAIGYLQTLGPNLDLERRNWKGKIVGLPKYYFDAVKCDRMTEKDVDKAFIVGMPTGDIDAVVQSRRWLEGVRKAGSDFSAGKIDEVQFSNLVLGAYVPAIGWEWVIYQRLPDLYAGYFSAESQHRMQAHWDRRDKAMWENRDRPSGELAAIKQSEQAILDSAARIDFDHFVHLMQDASPWITDKHHAIGARLMALRQDLSSRSKAKDDLYFQQANYAKERFFIVWYGASYNGPQTYPNQRKRMGYRTSASGFQGIPFVEKFPYPDVQVSPSEAQFLGYFLTLALPEPAKTEGRDAPRFTLKLAPMDFTQKMTSNNDTLRAKARDLAMKKSDLEREITALVESPSDLVARLDALADRQAAVGKKMVSLEDDLKVIRDLEMKSADVRGLIEEQERQCQMRNELLVTAADGGAVKPGEFETLSKTIKIIGEVIDQKLRGTPAEGLRKKWLAGIDSLRNESLQIDQMSIQLQNAALDLTAKVEGKRDELRELDKELLAVIVHIETPYPGLIGVSVEGEGREVLRARSVNATENLDDIDGEIAAIEEVIQGMKEAQAERKHAFQQAAAASVASGNRLASKIMVVAVEKAAIDAWFHLIDFSEAFASGGYVGLAMSVAQKELEANIIEQIIPKSDDKPAPGSPEDIINKAYSQADLRDALTLKNAKAVGLNRLFKETGTRYAKDKTNQLIGAWVHARIETPLTLWATSARAASSTAESYARQSSMIAALAKETEGLAKGYSYMPSPAGLSPEKLAEARTKKIQKLSLGIARDILKTGMKAVCDQELFLAWKDYSECVLLERLRYKPYIMGLWLRQDSYDAIDELMLRRAQLTSGLTTAQATLKTEWSDAVKSNAVLTITLTFSGAEDMSRPLRVFVGGVEAGRVGQTSTFRISAGKCQPGPDGFVPVQVR